MIGIFRTALNNAPSCSVMEQKEQPPKQPRMMLIEADHLIRRDTGVAVRRVRHAFVRQRKDAVHLFGGAGSPVG